MRLSSLEIEETMTEKSKGRFPLRETALTPDFLKIWSGLQITT